MSNANSLHKAAVAVFGGGCFWCTEAAFNELKGVMSVVSGYAGGATVTDKKPTYDEVSTGMTGHAEVIKVEYDPASISYRDLLTVFFTVHDPTTMNRQGRDVGTQYRSIILYTTPEQKAEAEAIMSELTAAHTYEHEMVTEVAPLDAFYEAESYHRRYYANNSDKPYCRIIINPKLAKLRVKFAKLLK